MELDPVLQRLGIAAALGMLIGLQRQRGGPRLGGIRTYTLISLYGAVAAQLATAWGAWLPAAGLLALAAALVVARPRDNAAGDDDDEAEGDAQGAGEAKPSTDGDTPRKGPRGITTEIAALLTYVLGAWTMVGPLAPAVVVAGATALLLHIKAPVHGLVRRISAADWTAIMRFVLIALVILPLLPDRTYGPYDVLNPHNIWIMVVLIVGIGLAGYVAYQMFGGTAGSLLGGALGGLISSTATTANCARQARAAPAAAGIAALVATIASTVAIVRVMVAIAAVAPGKMQAMWPPLASFLGWMGLVCAGLWLFTRREAAALPHYGNPAQLRTAFIFAGLYAGVLVAVAAVKQHFGDAALYGVAMVSGLTDMDAITLSTARLAQEGRLAADTAWRVIVVAALANLVFKGAMAAVVGGWRLGARLGIAFGCCLLAGVALVWLWPTPAAAVVPDTAIPATHSTP